MRDDRRPRPRRRRSSRLGPGIVLGAGAGMLLGAAFGDPGVGMVLGAAVGVAVPAVFERRLRR